MSNIVNYQKLMHSAMCKVIKDALTVIAKPEYCNSIHVVISFLTQHKGVILPDHVKNSYPNEITIVLQHQFRHLCIHDNHISVVLSFNGKEEAVTITYCSITKYVDAYQGFSLDLKPYINSIIKEEDNNSEDSPKEDKNNAQDNIIFIDTFLKK
ncbi:hypothetical protein EHRUM1_03340 [Ehrlichia ruminantium]|uniref:ClpXP protease specificity-enhancing factor SspB n=1 Tax=Ehrlichia ruminantium TaxID=779 RepID=UPI0007A02090|nr:ClpXP protease specificity-enhancing factor SspB [Ehrlichia ruminantium]KYW92954.1 hypothetical protein AUR40_02605 [Ehrlichia ruminantium]QLK52267.1 hypothetical protein FDZ65_01905 [Ehrlichia ruminantium]QLK54098.1 hypothetical protein FDZ63_01900 [Ehrlichia ruminantium]QLK56849.1 hypothetical protein FDZ60_01900 [Ehrlichia ruminantium]GAT76166.1 hypothetical protein EHRUM1_03340 [Ehrlichia ruminantium]